MLAISGPSNITSVTHPTPSATFVFLFNLFPNTCKYWAMLSCPGPREKKIYIYIRVCSSTCIAVQIDG